MSDYISLIAISGILGVVNYWLFDIIGFLNFFDHSKIDEKNSLIILLGLTNFVVNDIIRILTNNNWYLTIYFVASFFLALIIEVLILWILKYSSKKIKEIYFDDKKSYGFYIPIIEKILEENLGSEKVAYVYIYNFDNEIIEHGRVFNYSGLKSEENVIVLELPPNHSKKITDFDVLKKYFPIDDTMNVYINFDKGYKMYIVEEDKEESE